MRLWLGLLAVVGIVLFAGSAVASERIEELYDDDPLGLIAGFNVTSHYSLGGDIWDVWICRVPQGTLELSLGGTVELLNAEIVPYFDWLSGGRYDVSFRVGGVVEVESFNSWLGCTESVWEAAENITQRDKAQGAVIIVNMPTFQSVGSIGFISHPSLVEVKAGGRGDDTFPSNGRSVSVSGASVAEPGSLPGTTFASPLPILSTVAHEMGHAIGFPHSYRFAPYDHPMDIMGDSAAVPGLQVATIAINRYAAGWLDPENVDIYTGGKYTYRLSPPGDGGTQMLVLQSDHSGYITLGARVRKGYDSGIPKEGVESYYIDQQPKTCGSYSVYKACFGSSRFTQAVISPTRTVPFDMEDKTAHVMQVGDGYTWEGFTVTVTERIGDAFVVEVDDNPSAASRLVGRDVDDIETNERIEELYGDDPLGIVAGFNVTSHYGLGKDIWDVWICNVPDGNFELSLQESVELLNAEIVPYFDWLSGGHYDVSFRAAGVIEAASFDNWGGCSQPVLEASSKLEPTDRPEGAVIIANTLTGLSFGGFGTVSYVSPVKVRLFSTTYPENYRDIMLNGASVAPSGSLPPRVFLDSPLPILSIVAHEMGHAVGFPHSHFLSAYDNPMDVMGDSDAVPGLRVGTIAMNRYAAGWLDPDDVEIYKEGRNRYRLSPPGDGGTQMLVLQSDHSGYITLGARARKGYDSGIPKEGVESYYIDQQPRKCSSYPKYQACFGTSRRTRAVIGSVQTVPIDLEDTTAHVMEVGDGYTWEGITVTVAERIGDDFLVEVIDRTTPNRFTDDDWNIHEQNIETIAALGITLGCNPPANDQYCPSRPVSRAEMAALLVRALGETVSDTPTASRFSDVPQGARYLGYVERLAELNIVMGDTEEALFRPSAPLTRLEMAVWMARAFDSIPEVVPRGVFSDVPGGAWYAGAVEGLLATGVTKGCSADPPAYCPHDQVSRDQMASFLARALTR